MISLVGLDWGSSNVRGFAFDANGNVLRSTRANAGAMTLVSSEAFNNVFDALLGELDVNDNAVPVIACGMIGARGGWIEAGYCGINADAETLRRATKEIVTRSGHKIAVVPGVVSEEPDVMRGEETQIIGSDAHTGLFVMPGTHSKWVRMENGKIVEFKSYFTGEMNSLLRNSSTIGKTFSTEPSLDDEAAIRSGIERARTHMTTWLHDLFGFRARVVSGARTALYTSSELSAWLIASEFAQACATFREVRTIYISANDSLLSWYRQIARDFAIECIALDSEACAARGLWRIANSV